MTGLNETAAQEILDGMPETSIDYTSEADAPALPVLSSSIYRVRILLGDIKSELMNAICGTTKIARKGIVIAT
jgi:hypothetical protein